MASEFGPVYADDQSMRLLWVLPLFFLASPIAGQTPLYWAIANNDALEVWKLTAVELPPPSLDENGLSPPAWAVARGSGEVIDVLTLRGVPLDQIDAQGRNLLFGAAARGRLDLFEKIEAAGAQLDLVDLRGQTLIHAAAPSPHPIMLKTLLARGLGAVSRSDLGVTPLMLACLGGRSYEAAILLAWGSVPEDQDYLGRGVRDYAVAGGDPATLQVIDEALTPWTIEPDGGDLLP